MLMVQMPLMGYLLSWSTWGGLDFPRNYPEITMWVMGKEGGQGQGAPTTKPGLGNAGFIPIEQQSFATTREGGVSHDLHPGE
jgi:hypothetical protein